MIEQDVIGTGKVAVVGHRGAMGYAPENTLTSFRKAAQLGVHAVECDVRLTKDEEVVVMHDPTLKRVCGVDELVSETTLEALRRLRVGASDDKGLAGDTIPTLSEVLDVTLSEGIDIVVELKGEPEPPRKLVRKTVELIQAKAMQDRVAIISFHHPSLLWVRELDESIPTGILFGHGTPDPIDEARTFGAFSVRPHHARITPELVDACHATGLCLHTWTLNDAQLARSMVEMGVDSIAGDYPDILIKVVDEMDRLP